MTKAILWLLIACLTLSLTGAATAQNPFPDGTAISLLHWQHFVPSYDEWFDDYAAKWGADNNVTIIIDRVNFTELPSALAAEIEAGEGHTIIESLSPLSSFAKGLHDLSDIMTQAQQTLGQQLDSCRAASYLPAIDAYYGFAYGHFLNHGNYDIELWTDVGYPNGPTSYQDLLTGGRAIYNATGIPVGIGISPEIDSEMANREILWSFGASIQDANENVTLNSPAAIAAVEYLAQLQNQAMTSEVFGWTGASNNQALIAGEASFIMNPDSAYRSLQKIDQFAASNIGFTPALSGPAAALGGSYINISVIPKYVNGDQLTAAKKFILDYTANYQDATYHSELYNLPCFPSAVTELHRWLDDDPFGSIPANKFAVLKSAIERSVTFGHPGPTNPAIGQIYAEHLIPNMVAKVALGELSAAESVAQTHAQIEAIFADWRARGFVGGS